MGELAVRTVDRESWADFAALFESPGAPGYCWCMAWRPLPAKERNGPSAARHAARKALVEAVGTAGSRHVMRRALAE